MALSSLNPISIGRNNQYIKDPNKSNTQKYFRHSNVKRYELALLRSGYFFYFSLLYYGEVTIDIYKDIFDHFNIQ